MKYNTCYANESADKIQMLANKMHIKKGYPKVINCQDGMILPRKVGRNLKCPYQGAGGVIDKNGNFILESAIYDLNNDPKREYKLAFGAAYEVKDYDVLDETVIYLGLAHQHWGHFLVDVVQRLWYPLKENYLNSSGNKYVFCGFGNDATNFSGNFLEFFNLIGIPASDVRIINKPTKFKKIIIPDVAVCPGEYIYEIFQDIFNLIIDQALEKEKDTKQVERIYFSRTHLKDKKEMGERKIENVMQKVGFTIMYPEELSLTKQIFYWHTAKEIACIAGSIPHNCVFASKDIKLYIFNKMSQIFGYQFTMDAVQQITPIYVSTYREPYKHFPISVSRGPFWIFITKEFKDFIKKKYSLDIKYEKTKIEDKVHYIILCIIVGVKYRFKGLKSKTKILIKKIRRFI